MEETKMKTYEKLAIHQDRGNYVKSANIGIGSGIGFLAVYNLMAQNIPEAILSGVLSIANFISAYKVHKRQKEIESEIKAHMYVDALDEALDNLFEDPKVVDAWLAQE